MPPAPNAQPPATHRAPRWLWPFMLLLGSATMVVAWSSLALATGRQHGWLALLAALEAAWMLRLGGMPAGWPRRLLAAATTVAMAVAVQWFVVAGHIGGQMGMAPWEAAPKMGAFHVWILARLANTWFDVLCLALAPLLALRAAR
ncbi:hypothetical protein [Pseudoxanthomonas suwonensis]|uniref:Transmembrane protein n=1 Tax=Pseudoxanthomonas suwonensis TaxID=314722 RepID=A0A0E3Z0G7_9GAMM|nr:hypothetical protein [Pseudoxanthomonas suwonensis]AKC86047.1 hypothetical protein WQ53_03945 [Pseudoxanthomonas suwonensis]